MPDLCAFYRPDVTCLPCSGSRKRGESGAPLRATASALRVPSVQNAPRHIAPDPALIVPESVRATDDSVFTAADWSNVLKGYSSQYVEHDYWVDESMIEGTSPASPRPVWSLKSSIASLMRLVYCLAASAYNGDCTMQAPFQKIWRERCCAMGRGCLKSEASRCPSRLTGMVW